MPHAHLYLGVPHKYVLRPMFTILFLSLIKSIMSLGTTYILILLLSSISESYSRNIRSKRQTKTGVIVLFT